VARAVADAREVADARANRGSARAAWWTELGFGGGYLVAVALLLGVWSSPTWRDAGVAVLLALVHGIASRVVFESSGGGAVPTAPILVAALFLVPLPLVPAIVLVGLLIGAASPAGERGVHRVLIPAISGWNALGLVAVIAVSDTGQPAIEHWPWYLLALVAQFAIDALVAFVRVRSLGMSWRILPRPMAWTYLVDLTLAPVGLTAVIASNGSLWSIAFASTPVALLALLARDRAEHLEKAVVISEAFEHAIETARTDALTGIGNRRAWNEATGRAAVQHAADPTGCPVTVVLGDLDRLKQVNDTHGHDAGDELIVAAARVFADSAPPGALVARIGGDEFGMLVVGRDVLEADLIAAMRQRMRSMPPVHGVSVSLSLGASSCPPLPDVEAALTSADSLAFADKAARRAGRA
jgi:diguanylate cyclase (GGDEF)-like protein